MTLNFHSTAFIIRFLHSRTEGGGKEKEGKKKKKKHCELKTTIEM